MFIKFIFVHWLVITGSQVGMLMVLGMLKRLKRFRKSNKFLLWDILHFSYSDTRKPLNVDENLVVNTIVDIFKSKINIALVRKIYRDIKYN